MQTNDGLILTLMTKKKLTLLFSSKSKKSKPIFPDALAKSVKSWVKCAPNYIPLSAK